MNLGDSYAASGGKQVEQTLLGIKPKDLIGIPWMVAFALRADGWYLRSEIIWAKPNPMPESVRDRPTRAHEQIFLLSKSPRYFYDAFAIAEPSKYPDDDRKARSKVDHKRMPTDEIAGVRPGSQTYPTRNKRSVWIVTSKPYKEAHFATYPPDLIEPCILAGTSAEGQCPACGAPWVRVVNKSRSFQSGSGRSGNMPIGKNGKGLQGGGETIDVRRGPVLHTSTSGWNPSCDCNAGDPVPQIVLDPFSGSGTTGEVALRNRRKYFGLDLNFEYIGLSKKRTTTDVLMF